MENFKIGDKVICIKEFKGLLRKNNIVTNIKSPDILPIKGNIYTVFNIASDGSLFLEEIKSKYGYNYEKFRKVDDTFATEVESMVKKFGEDVEIVEKELLELA